MTITDQVRRLYRDNGRGGSFPDDLQEHIARGYVFSTPEALLMGFRCRSDDVMQAIHDRARFVPSQADDEGDTWFVWLAVGNLAGVLRYVPYPAKFVAFSRKNVVKLYRFKELTRLANAFTLSNLAVR